jgi:hypothetical protein
MRHIPLTTDERNAFTEMEFQDVDPITESITQIDNARNNLIAQACELMQGRGNTETEARQAVDKCVDGMVSSIEVGSDIIGRNLIPEEAVRILENLYKIDEQNRINSLRNEVFQYISAHPSNESDFHTLAIAFGDPNGQTVDLPGQDNQTLRELAIGQYRHTLQTHINNAIVHRRSNIADKQRVLQREKNRKIIYAAGSAGIIAFGVLRNILKPRK